MHEHTSDPVENDTCERRRLTIGLAVSAVVLAAGGVTATQVVGAGGDDGASAARGAQSAPQAPDADAVPTDTGDTEADGTAGAGAPAAMCAAELSFRGETYTQAGTGDLVEGRGESLGTATVPPCQDTPGQEQAGDAIATVEVFAVDAGPDGGSDGSTADLIYAHGAVWTLAPQS